MMILFSSIYHKANVKTYKIKKSERNMKHLVQLLIYHFACIVPAVVHAVLQVCDRIFVDFAVFYGQVVCLFWDDKLSVTSRSCGPQGSDAFGCGPLRLVRNRETLRTSSRETDPGTLTSLDKIIWASLGFLKVVWWSLHLDSILR